MDEIPQPQVLDPDRPLRRHGTQITADDRPREELLGLALRESCAYGQQLWDDLNTMRGYLLDSLPPDPHATATAVVAASPTGPDDEHGWHAWTNAFAEVTSALCGPQGDGGFGLQQARAEAHLRRTQPPSPRVEAPTVGSPDAGARSLALTSARPTPLGLRDIAAAAVGFVAGVLVMRSRISRTRSPRIKDLCGTATSV